MIYGTKTENCDFSITVLDYSRLSKSILVRKSEGNIRTPESFRSAVNVHLCVLVCVCVCACAIHIYIYIFRAFSIVTYIEQTILTMSEYHTKVGEPYVKDWNVFSEMYNEIPCQLVLQKAVVNGFHSCDGTFVHVLH